jgi:hypothetical protein
MTRSYQIHQPIRRHPLSRSDSTPASLCAPQRSDAPLWRVRWKQYRNGPPLCRNQGTGPGTADQGGSAFSRGWK